MPQLVEKRIAARQSGLAWRLFRVSALVNVTLAIGIVACGMYCVVFNKPGYIAADSNLHFSNPPLTRVADESSLRLVDKIHEGKTEDGTVPEKGQDEEAGAEEEGAAAENGEKE